MALGKRKVYGFDDVLDDEGTRQFELRTPPPRLLKAPCDDWEDIGEADVHPDTDLTRIFP